MFFDYHHFAAAAAATASVCETQAEGDKDSLRISVEKLFNKLYNRLYGFPVIVLRITDNAGDYVHKPGAKLLYSKVKARGYLFLDFLADVKCLNILHRMEDEL